MKPQRTEEHPDPSILPGGYSFTAGIDLDSPVLLDLTT
jgi:hypothetical protein